MSAEQVGNPIAANQARLALFDQEPLDVPARSGCMADSRPPYCVCGFQADQAFGDKAAKVARQSWRFVQLKMACTKDFEDRRTVTRAWKPDVPLSTSRAASALSSSRCTSDLL